MSAPDYARYKPEDFSCAHGGVHRCENARSGILPGDVWGTRVKRFVEGQDRAQLMLLPECLDDFVGEHNPVRVVDAFIEELDLAVLGFTGVVPEATGRPSYHPAMLLKIYLYGYLNRVQSSRRLEREARRNLEVMWLTGRLTPDFKTIADFRRDNGLAIRGCAASLLHCAVVWTFSPTPSSPSMAANSRP
jgi:transposase